MGRIAVGIDVSSKKLDVAVHEGDEGSFENSPPGHKKLLKWLKKQAKRKGVTVVLESTGYYGLDIALFLHEKKNVDVHYVNPMAAKGYAKAGMVRAKTDKVDARVLARMAHADRSDPWNPPAPHLRALRAYTRRIRTLINNRTREKNRLAALSATGTTPEPIVDDIRDTIGALDARIDKLWAAALEFAKSHADLRSDIELLDTVAGIGERSAVELLGEIRCMPEDLTAKQLVAQAGLDPRARQSGMRDGKRSISKMGSSNLRAALHMVAVTAVRSCPQVKAYYTMLVEQKGKAKLVALVAVARKLLHCIHGMMQTNTPWDPARFYMPRTVSA